MPALYAPTCRALLALVLFGPLGTAPSLARPLRPISRQAFTFLTLTVLEATERGQAKLLFAPSFQAQGEVSLEALDSESAFLNEFSYRRNSEKVTKYLDALSADGWELVEVHPAPYLPNAQVYATRYLFRKPR